MADLPNRTQSQEELSKYLSPYDSAKDAYFGALYALQHKEYPDRLVHFAHSLREVICQLYAFKERNKDGVTSLSEESKKKNLKDLFDPLGHQTHLMDISYDRLLRIYRDLSKSAHHSNTILHKNACEYLSEVEDILQLLFRPQLEINAEIDRILIGSPSLDSARDLVLLQSRRTTSSQLAEKIPDFWLPYMKKAGFFDNPLPTNCNQGRINYDRWMQAVYLQKCVKTFGDDVTDIIISCKFRDRSQRNPAVYMDFLMCAVGLSPDNMEMIGKKALEETWDDFIDCYGFATKYVEMAEKLFSHKKYDVSTGMLFRALRPKRLKSSTITLENMITGTYPKTTHPFDLSIFQEILLRLSKLAQKDPLPMIKLLDDLLYELMKMENLYGGQDQDYYEASYWLYAIEEPNPNPMYPIQSLFIRCILDCITHAVQNKQNKEAMGILYRRNYCIYRRIEHHIYTKFPNIFKREVALLALWYFDYGYLYNDYHRLLERVFPVLPDSVRKEILDRIDMGYDPHISKQFQSRQGQTGTAKAEKTWKFRCLETIKEHLDSKRKKVCDDLCTELDKQEPSNYPTPETIPAGNETSNSILNGKKPDEIFKIMQDYVISDPFHIEFDIADEFGQYVKDNPLECSKRASMLRSADSRIQYELFLGLYHAVRNGKNVEWDDVVSLIENVSTSHIDAQNRPSQLDGPVGLAPETQERFKPRVSNTRDPLLPLYFLMEEGLKEDSLDFDLRGKIWNILKMLVDIGKYHEESEKYTGESSALDISKNNINGTSFHIVYQYAVWCKKHDNSEQTLVPEVKQIFDEYLDGETEDHTISRHAVFGFYLPGFYRLDRKWVRSKLERMSSCLENTRIAFWDGYVSWNRLYTDVFDDIWRWYDKFMNKNMQKINFRCQESTTEHVFLAYFYGREKAEPIVKKFLGGESETIKHCVSSIRHILNGKNDNSDFNKDKFIRLWKHHSLKKHDLSIWFEHTPLDKKTSITLYRDHLKLYPNKINMMHSPLGKLGEYVESFPLEVAECLEEMIGKCDNNYIPDDARDILKLLLKSENSHVKKTCATIIEKAAQAGYSWSDLLSDRTG